MAESKGLNAQQVVQKHILHDVLVFLGLFVAVFGSSFALHQSSQSETLSKSRNFTELASAQAGEEFVKDWGSPLSNLAFELGWSNRGVGLANAWTRFVDKPSQELMDDTSFKAIAQIDSQPEGYVLGAADEPTSETNNHQVSPWFDGASLPSVNDLDQVSEQIAAKQIEGQPYQRDNQPYFWGIGPTGIVAQPAEISYTPIFGDVTRVDFYLNGSLVTSDSEAPYYLGGDNQGNPYGYDLSATQLPAELEVKIYGPGGELVDSNLTTLNSLAN